jgi:hypothetical protein
MRPWVQPQYHKKEKQKEKRDERGRGRQGKARQGKVRQGRDKDIAREFASNDLFKAME